MHADGRRSLVGWVEHNLRIGIQGTLSGYTEPLLHAWRLKVKAGKA